MSGIVGGYRLGCHHGTIVRKSAKEAIVDEKEYIPPPGSKWHSGTFHVETAMHHYLRDLGFDIPPGAIIHEVIGPNQIPHNGVDQIKVCVTYATDDDTPRA
jgi:hypothetical protein